MFVIHAVNMTVSVTQTNYERRCTYLLFLHQIEKYMVSMCLVDLIHLSLYLRLVSVPPRQSQS